MKPPKVSRKLLASAPHGGCGWEAIGAEPKGIGGVRIARHPTGILANALPEYWIVARPDGSWWLMRRAREGGDDACVAVVPASVVAQAQASRVPLVLEAR